MNLGFLEKKTFLFLILPFFNFVLIIFSINLFVQVQIYSAKFFVIKYLESKFGFRIKYDKISPYFLSSIKIDGLELSLDGKDKILMDVVRVDLNLFKLILGDENIILNVYVKGSNLNFDINDFSLSDDLNSNNAYFDNGNVILNKILNYLYRLNINLENININIKLNKNNSWLSFKVKNFSLSTLDDDFLFSSVVDFSAVKNLEINLPSKRVGDEILDSTFYFEGKFKKGFEDGYVNFSFFEFKTSYFSLLEQGFQINYSKGNLKIFNLQRENFDFNLSYDKSNDFIRLDALFFNVNLLDWIRLSKDFEVYKDYFDISLNGQLAFSYDFKDKDLRYAGIIDSSLNVDAVGKEIQGLQLEIKGNDSIVSVKNAFLKLKRGVVNYKGYYSLKDLLPIGRLNFKSAKILNFNDLNGYLDFNKDKNIFLVKSDNFSLGDLSFQNLSLKTYFLKDKILVDYLIYLENKNSQISLKGDLNDEELSLNLGIKEFPLLFLKEVIPNSYLINFFPQALFSGKYLNLVSDFNFNRFDYHKNILKKFNFMVFSKLDNFKFMFDASGEKNFYKSNNFDLQYNDYNLHSSLLVELFESGFNIITNFSYLDKNYPLHFNVDLKNKFIVAESPLGIKLDFNYFDSKIIYTLNVNGFKVYNKTSDLLININFHGSYLGLNDDLKFKIDKFNIIKASKIPFYNFNFDFKGLYEYDKLYITNVRFINKLSNLQGYGQFNLKDNLNGSLNLFSSLNSERYFLGINSDEHGSYFLLKFQDLDFYNFNSLSLLEGKVSGNFLLNFKKNNFKNYSLSGYLEADKLNLLGIPVQFSLNLGLLDNKLNIYDIKAKRNKKEFLTGSLRYDLSSSIGVSNMVFNSDLFSYKFNANFKNFESRDEELFGVLKTKTEGEFSFRDIKYKNEFLSNLTVEFSNDFEKFNMASIDYDLINILYHYGSGEYSFILKDYLPLSFNSSGKIIKNKILGNVRDIKFDSKIITKDFLDSHSLFNIDKHFILYDLVLDGEFDIDGDLHNPNINGILNIQKGSMSTEYLRASRKFGGDRALEIFDMPVKIQDNKIIFSNEFDLDRYSKAFVSTSLNLNFLSDTIIDYYKIDINVTGRTGAPIKFDKIALSFTGYALGNFSIEGNADEIMFKGVLNISNAWVYSLESSIVDLLVNPFKRAKSAQTIDVNVQDFDILTHLEINFDSGVTFHWPDSNISFLQTTISRGDKLVIKSDTKTDDFILKGDLNIANGFVNYNNKKFIFKSGAYISFNESRTKFDPWIKAEATNTIKDRNDKLLVTISIDSPLSLWKIEFMSYPFRTEQEIKYLLSGSTMGGAEEGGLRSAGTNAAEMAIGIVSDIALDFLIQPIEDYMRSVLNLDLLSIKTDILKNSINSNFFKIGNPTFVDVLDNTSVKVGKYLVEGVFISGGFGFLKEQMTPFSKDLNFVINLGIEFDSPFFLVNYEFDYNFMKKGLDGIGNNIGISWKFRY
ncbi:translocation/assembly module TamB domain-containing protein [Borreliella tanukii]|uniref:translocation/assembly module TamB domain-containing protein n=1 Tax=Borreliella tanukii TaxID=56146 RepID=UPI002648C3E6|nr:translocation/assembly module TamB domain-containing protein [Borreliella tanukii]WKC81071.1 translocation/assembly module TamB domain-containing protein [Borreliella tanukii]